MNKIKTYYLTSVIGSVAGLAAAFWQTLEKLALLKNPGQILSCNLDSVFSCSNVLNAPQSSVFGFPNSLIAMTFFTFFLTVGLVGLSGGRIGRTMRLWVQGLALFMLGFALWFLYQSTFNIQAICIFCLFIFGGVLAVNGAWLRLNEGDMPLSKSVTKRLSRWMASGADIFVWLLLALVVGSAIFFKFYA